MAQQETTLTIQTFHQCASLISEKLNASNYLLWKSPVIPLVRTLELAHHLIEDAPAIPEITEIKEDSAELKLQRNTCSNNDNDGLLTAWFFGIIGEDVLAFLEGTKTAKQVWHSLEDLLLTMTKENEIHINEILLTLKKENLSLGEYIRQFKGLCNKLAAMRKSLDDLSKVFYLARGLGSRYREFRTAMLSKLPYPSYNQFNLGLKTHDQSLAVEEEEEKTNQININQAFYTRPRQRQGRRR